MCMMCEGATYEEALAAQVATTEAHGWSIMGVTGHRPWSYTIGLRWYLDCPELIIVGFRAEFAWGLLHEVVDRVGAGETLRVGSTMQLFDHTVSLGRVHERNLAGEWFAQWPAVAAGCGRSLVGLRALQVRVDNERDCPKHGPMQTMLERRCAGTPGGASRGLHRHGRR